jgi:formylglycine-generating enzyme required for sulfatase activity
VRKKALLLCALPALLAAAQEPAPTLRLDLGEGVSMELVLVKAGSFEQGSPESERGRATDEALRKVTLTRDFYIGKHEVTVLQFSRFVQESGYKTEAEKGTSGGFGWDGKALVQNRRYNWLEPGYQSSNEHPVTIVTFDDAAAFAAWLQRRTRREVTLPSEAEWEYAARGGSATRFFAGDSDAVAPQIGWHKANAGSGPQPVGQKKPNGFGLYDTAGNVYEWCRDWYGPYLPGPVSDPLETRQTLSDRPRRVLRGGSWLKQPGDLRSAARYRNAPGSRNADNGFRVVAAAQATTAAAAPAVQPQPAQAARPTAQPEPGASLLSYLLLPFACALPILLGIVFVLKKGLPGIFGDRGSPRIKQARDGFTIVAPRARPGETIRYRYVVDGKPETGEMTVPSDPSQGMFVFTGTTPSNVEVLSVLAAAAAAMPGRPRGAAPPPPPPAQRRTPDRTRRDDDDYDDSHDSFRGYPSAY